MRTSNCQSNTKPRCHTPLLEICATTSQIKLDLGSCDVCSATATALHIQQGGCVEYETVCEPVNVTCGSCPSLRMPTRRVIAKPKIAVLYPIHEIDSDGYSVFVLDNKLHDIGVGRYRATVLLDTNPTDVVFDIEYVQNMALHAIVTESSQPYERSC